MTFQYYTRYNLGDSTLQVMAFVTNGEYYISITNFYCIYYHDGFWIETGWSNVSI